MFEVHAFVLLQAPPRLLAPHRPLGIVTHEYGACVPAHSQRAPHRHQTQPQTPWYRYSQQKCLSTGCVAEPGKGAYRGEVVEQPSVRCLTDYIVHSPQDSRAKLCTCVHRL